MFSHVACVNTTKPTQMHGCYVANLGENGENQSTMYSLNFSRGKYVAILPNFAQEHI